MEEEIFDEVEELEEDDFQVPEFLKETCSEEEIHQRMLDELPEDIDKSEGGYIYDLTRPTAIEVARMKEFELVETIKLIWPRFAEGIYLDYHAETRGLERKEATNASGKLYIEGKIGTLISEGTIFMTESINDEPAKEYVTLEDAEILEGEDGTGSVEVEIQSIEAGMNGNSAAGTVLLQDDISEDITLVINKEPITGGMEAEEDESLRERIMEYDQAQGQSFIGNINDYKRWATSVEGVGDAVILTPEDDSGVIEIVITDSNGQSASEELCQSVYDLIMQPDDPEKRLAPINAKIDVKAQKSMLLTVSADVELRDAKLETVEKTVASALNDYLKFAANDGEIRYTQVCKILGNTEGIYDYKNLIVKNAEDSSLYEDTAVNLPIPAGSIPMLQSVTLTETEVLYEK